MDDPRERWNDRYADSEPPTEPTPLVEAYRDRLRPAIDGPLPPRLGGPDDAAVLGRARRLHTSGLVTRMTVALHPTMRPVGLTGRDLVRVVMGFGCNVPDGRPRLGPQGRDLPPHRGRRRAGAHPGAGARRGLPRGRPVTVPRDGLHRRSGGLRTVVAHDDGASGHRRCRLRDRRRVDRAVAVLRVPKPVGRPSALSPVSRSRRRRTPRRTSAPAVPSRPGTRREPAVDRSRLPLRRSPRRTQGS